jgi:tetratricopeptide (TPR) repeat protein
VKTTPAEQKKLAYALCHRADRLRAQGEYGQAESLFKQALALAEQTFAPEGLDDALVLTAVLNNHAVLYKYSGRFDEAEQLYRRALQLAVQHLGEDHTEIATIYHNLGGLEHTRGRFAVGELAASLAQAQTNAAPEL